jgi:protein gp37
LNKTKIEYCDYTWNCIVGCNNNCEWCYARKIAKRFFKTFKPTFHPERLNEPTKVKMPSVIFADSMSDFWGKGTKQKWRDAIYKTMKSCQQHTFLLLTKQPQLIQDTQKIPRNCWVGVSVSTFQDRWRIGCLLSKKVTRTFVSIEPILDNTISSYVYMTNWVIVGALTGKKNAFKPAKQTIEEIIRSCHSLSIPLFLKDNLEWKEKLQEFPIGVN